MQLLVPNGQDYVIVEVNTWNGNYQTPVDRARVPIAVRVEGEHLARDELAEHLHTVWSIRQPWYDPWGTAMV